MNNKKKIAIISFVAIFIVLFFFADFGTLFMAYQNKDYCYLSTGVGNSMEPTISDGDMLIILLSYSPDFSLDVGDILVYNYDDSIVVGHRIIDIRGDRYYVQGDNNPLRDSVVVDGSLIIGKIIGIIDGGNFVSKTIVNLYI